MKADTGYPELAAYLLDVLLRNDRGIRVVGPPCNRKEWGIERVGAYLHAIGQETVQEEGDTALWVLLRSSIALLPSRREEAVFRLVRVWAPLGWLNDQNIPAPTKPAKYRPLAIERIAG
jgi:hypothetical protein